MNTFQETFHIRYSEGDRHGRLKLRTFFDYAQEVAGSHAAALGCGLEALLARRQAWVLSRIRVRFHKYPSIGDAVTLKTWPSGFDHLFARREFELTGVDGTVLAEATSFWLFLDTAQMRILNAAKEIGDLMPDNSALPVHFSELGKLPAPAEGEQLEFSIRETQIDLNGHLNNAEYAGVIQDVLGAGCYPAELQVNYQKSVPPQSLLGVTCARAGQEFQIAGRVADAVAFAAGGTLMS
ncbi:MAG: hypothetical protein II943_09640 [Victivallales bacterium]|nr:hypothetical protein [Victivallales bacterium]